MTIIRLLCWTLVGIAAAWVVLAAWFYTPLSGPGRVAMAVSCAGWWIYLFIAKRSSTYRWVAFLATMTAATFAWNFVQPSLEGDWSRLHSRMIEAKFEGDLVQLNNVRNTEQNGDGTYQVTFQDREFELNRVQSIWFGVQQFISWRGGSHTFVSFGFDDGEYLAISVEARRGEGQAFNPLRGMFKQCGLIYVVGSELDIIGNRVAESEYPVYLYPLRATPAQSREMLVAMLQRADNLRREPEFYHTTVNNCTTNIVQSFNQIAPIRISPHSYRVKFPGYSGQVAYDQGLIDSKLPFEEVQQRARINERAVGATAEDFSQRIRSGFAGSE